MRGISLWGKLSNGRNSPLAPKLTLGEQENQLSYAIYFISKNLTLVEKNYTITEKEFLAIMHEINKFEDCIIKYEVSFTLTIVHKIFNEQAYN